jgi:peroxiredoxin Q/BCP
MQKLQATEPGLADAFMATHNAVKQLDAALMENQTIPDFELPCTGETPFRLSEYQDRIIVLYFYPKDNTPGCTAEGMDFAANHAAFQAAGCELFGISRDSLKSHEGFKAKLNLPFELLSDEDEKACELFAVIKMKNMYGKKVRGIERSTFVLDRQGRIAKSWRGVKVPNHVQEVLAFVQTL